MNTKLLELISLYKEPYDFSNTMPIVFSPSKNQQPRQGNIIDNDILLASPWPKFSMEVEGAKKYLTTADFTVKETNYVYLDCIHCTELSFNKYNFLILVEVVDQFKNTKDRITVNLSKEYDNNAYQAIKSLVYWFLEILYEENTGTVASTNRIKYKKDNSKKKSIYKPKKIVYVSKKSRSKTNTANSGEKVIWSAGWTVRAHYRRIKESSMGKDRYGKRCIKGRTWVNGYCKGIVEDIKVRKVI